MLARAVLLALCLALLPNVAIGLQARTAELQAIFRIGGSESARTSPKIEGFDSSPNHETSLYRTSRIVQPTVCEDSVKQYSGYIDITDTKHLFFWFFESRASPKTAPLVLWLNGGPGASSLVSGLLYENGPCLFKNGTLNRNPYSWNERANIIYLDQPVGTGYSYFTGQQDQVTTLEPLAADVYTFLQLFLARFPEYAKAPLHLAGESFGGHFVPHIATHIHEANLRMVYAPRPGQFYLDLKTLTLVNALTEPRSQLGSMADYVCGGAPYPLFQPNSPRCRMLRVETPVCMRLIDACYKFDNPASCAAANAYCYPTLFVPLIGTDIYPNDVRKRCSSDDDCLGDTYPIVDWLNLPETKADLGANPDKNTSIMDMDIYAPFYANGQDLRNSAKLLPPLVKDGIRVLAFAGDADSVCNFIGVERWMSRLNHVFAAEFANAPRRLWRAGRDQGVVGEIRHAGPGAGNYTYARVYEAGHMAPHDKPEATLELFQRWIKNEPFSP